MSPRFVVVPADRLLAELRDIGARISARGGACEESVSGREIVFTFAVPGTLGSVRVFTSLAQGASQARDCGEDAVRLVLGFCDDKAFRPLSSSRKVLRTAPAGAEDRVAVFLERLRGMIREAYAEARDVPICHVCGAPMALRSTRDKSRKFLGCVKFPTCKGTRSVSTETK